tara:strand:+ start:195655 stop:195885 length:231 start_codon:yes stop_codon:yes gene_type:complete
MAAYESGHKRKARHIGTLHQIPVVDKKQLPPKPGDLACHALSSPIRTITVGSGFTPDLLTLLTQMDQQALAGFSVS